MSPWNVHVRRTVPMKQVHTHHLLLAIFQLATHHFARIPAGCPGCPNALHEVSRMQVSDIRVPAKFTSEACAGSFLILQGIRKETLVFPMVFTHFQSGAMEHCTRTLASAALYSTLLRCRTVFPAPPCGASGRATVWRGDNCRDVQKSPRFIMFSLCPEGTVKTFVLQRF